MSTDMLEKGGEMILLVTKSKLRNIFRYIIQQTSLRPVTLELYPPK